MSPFFPAEEVKLKPGWTGVVAVFLSFLAVIFRTLAIDSNRPLLAWYLGVQAIYLVLFVVLLLRPDMPDWGKHALLGLQSVAILYAISWRPEFDFLVVLFLLMSYPVSIIFTGKMRWAWVLILILLTGGALIFYLGLIRGLALSLITIAGEIVVPAFLIANHEIETARIKSQALLRELQATHRQLELYAAQVEDLAAVQERNRLARELHDTVSQLMFSINLTTRSVQMLMVKDPARVPEQLERLQSMSTDALAQLRALITQLRPPQSPEKQ